ncbi:2-keto-4-pentenoate hydratase [Streptomyces albogriseolus]|uniref:2-keto-4-pentenoate hydratase n=1 Tax=Streptomyces albogriseolus TaxID=1887 RepID=UPI00345FFA4F
MTDELLVPVARQLIEAARTHMPVERVSRRFPDLALQDAYRIQHIGMQLRLAAGERLAGHKVGLTSAAMQQQVGIDEPDSGLIFQQTVAPSRAEVRADDFMHPKIETEIAFRLGSDLTQPTDLPGVRAAVAEVLLAFELLDTRYDSWDITLVDSIADNACCAGVITGSAVPYTPDWDLAGEQITVEADGTVAATGSGKDVLGDPLQALVWLTHRLPALGVTLRAGDLVLAGSVHASLPLTPGTSYRATSTRLPAVQLQVA